MCSTWLATVLGEITSASAIFRLERPRASSFRTSTSRSVRPAGPPRRRGTRWPAAPSTASTASASRRAGLDLGAQLGRRLAGRQRRPVGARLAHGLVGVGGAEDPGRARDGGARQAARVARAVQALAVLHGDRAQRRQGLGLVQHALGDVGVHAHPLPFAGAQRAGLVPDRVRDPQPPEVVHVARAPQRPHLALAQPELRRRRRRRARRRRARARACTATSGRRSSRSPPAPHRSAHRRA